MELATLAGGCFWGVEELFRVLPGVLKTEVGYTGGETENAQYKDVKTGRTGHAEALQIQFDPAQTTYQDLLLYFYKIHDPTTANQQGNDIGSQYRSAIFFHSAEQKSTAEKVIARVNQSKVWPNPVVTQVIAFKKWWSAEQEHQAYLQKHPGGYTCHFERKIQFT